MPIVMSLEGPRQMPWAKIQNEAMAMLPKPFWRASTALSASRNSPCCWQCSCENNVCCDSASVFSRAYASARRTMSTSSSGRALRGITDGFRSHKVLTIAGLLFGGWLAGTSSGRATFAKAKAKFKKR